VRFEPKTNGILDMKHNHYKRYEQHTYCMTNWPFHSNCVTLNWRHNSPSRSVAVRKSAV